MKAITFAAPIPTYLTTLLAGKVNDALYTGAHACTRLTDIAAPALPNDRWVRVRTRLGGICGSDLNVITLKASPSTSPFSSFPFVIGHENVGDIVETGRAVSRVRPGQRVVVNPLLCCEPRSVDPPCAACGAGHHSQCAHFTDGALAPGMLIGTTRDLGGSWGEMFVAHESQVVPLPDAMSDEEGVMVEPLACAVHAVRSDMPAPGERVLVIGAGSIGLVMSAALKALVPSVRLTVLARHPFQADHARRLGADHVVFARGDYLRELADAGGARLLKPIIGKPVGVEGFNRTYVCIGSTRATDDALRVTRAGGVIVLLGNASTLNGIDWTPLWLKELTVRGSLCYGEHRHATPARDAFREAAELIATRRAAVGPLVTHAYPLTDYREALATAMDKKGSGSVKVCFRF